MYGKIRISGNILVKNRDAYWRKWCFCCNWGCGFSDYKRRKDKSSNDSWKFFER